MSFFGRWNPLLLAAAFFVAAAGCSPMDQGAQDEEREPHYVLGKSRVNAMNYDGAIEAFEESLEANPHSAAAHYQLAILFDNQESVADPAAAIYHYQQCLKYDPKFQMADVIAGRIDACKQKLAADVLQLPSAPAAQQQLEKLAEENRRLHDQLTQWQNYYAAQQAAAKTNQIVAQTYAQNYGSPQNNYSPQPQATSQNPDDVTPAYPSPRTTATPASRQPASRATSKPMRTHTVLRGETMAMIARNSGISLSTLMAANPSVNPKKLKAGQVLNLPSP